MAHEHSDRAALDALQWYLDNGVDIAIEQEPQNRFSSSPAHGVLPPQEDRQPPLQNARLASPEPEGVFLGLTESRAEAVRLAAAARTLEELRAAIATFEGLAIKKTARNMVFCDGNPRAPVMLVGEAPGADEDRLGRPFVGVSGQLLDRILQCIGLDRREEEPSRGLYISNILNWRPPGNRTPSPAEIAISLPFIERHIALAAPKILILCGGVSAKALLGRDEGISRLRRTWHDYLPQTREFSEGARPIPAIATYHPAYLLRTPGQKKAVWADMLMLAQKREELELK